LPPSDRLFWVASEGEIKSGQTTDVYFRYAAETLSKEGINPLVTMEVYARSLPFPGNWGVLCGVNEVAALLEGLPVDVHAMEEGEIFLTNPGSVVYEPVMRVEGRYLDFCVYENPVLGFLCSQTGIASKSARIRIAARGKTVFSFGSRRVHPAIGPVVERAAYIGGMDRVSNVLGAKLLKQKAVGTMPHAMIQCVGDQVEAWKAFDKHMPRDVPRIALIDTFSDEKAEAMAAYAALGKKLYGVRIDTPSSRRGDWRKIIEEVRWELNARSGRHVKIFLSGGLDEETVALHSDLVDGFGVGTCVSAAPVVDFSMKIVQLEEKGRSVMRAKRGDIGGRKQVFRNSKTFHDIVTLEGRRAPKGHKALLTPLLKNGRLVRKLRDEEYVHARVKTNLKKLVRLQPKLDWAV